MHNYSEQQFHFYLQDNLYQQWLIIVEAQIPLQSSSLSKWWCNKYCNTMVTIRSKENSILKLANNPHGIENTVWYCLEKKHKLGETNDDNVLTP